MIIALAVAFITADIAEMFHARLQKANFSMVRALIYFTLINLAYICYMFFLRQETFTADGYYNGPKAVLRYTAYALGLCAAGPVMFAMLTGPKKILSALRQSVWLSVSLTIILVFSVGSYLTYKNAQAVSMTTTEFLFSQQVSPKEP